MSEARVYIRRVEARDKKQILALANESLDLHQPWISPPLSSHMFKLYLRRTLRDDHEGLVICRRDNDEIVGVINVNNIVRGSFLSASLGYYVGQRHHGAGFMTEALKQTIGFAFDELGLHRIEANIQPSNARSRNLVKRCGFELEGISKAFLYINGEWRDHERWSLVDARQTLSKLSSLGRALS